MNHFHPLFRSDLITVFDYCCNGQDSTEDEPTNAYELTFLRSGTFVRRDADGTTVANPNHVVFFQPGRDCRITHPVPGGDHCTVVGVDLSQLAEMQRQLARSGQPEQPFPSTHTPAHSAFHLTHYTLLRALQNNADALFIEETVLTLVADVLASAYCLMGKEAHAARSSTARFHRDLVHDVQLMLAARFDQNLSISALADAAACSPYFLCRVFKRETGLTIHQYLQHLRLTHSFDLLLEALDITTIAHQLGFAHHSHFTSAFTRTYGVTPSTFRRTYRAKI